MIQSQLSLFLQENQNPKKQKKAKLGRYERIQRDLLTTNRDLHQIFVEVDSSNTASSSYNFIDLFCGAGGMTQRFVQAGFHPIASVEVSPIASATHQKNFPQCHHFCGDIYDFQPQKWLEQVGSPEIHLVVGGPPCQGFSVAGKRDPNDPRNRLFREFIRVVSEVKPWYVVMENIPGILTMQQGNVKEAILEEFKSIGYPNISVAILESAAYGIPQIRARYLSPIDLIYPILIHKLNFFPINISR